MGLKRVVHPSLLVVSCFSRHPEALLWAKEQLEKTYGPVGVSSPPYDFEHTHYYETEMGSGLKKQFLVFHDLAESDSLATIKNHTNLLEEELKATGGFLEQRPLNLDPGFLQLGKFMLATTKDQAHRIYLRDGIYAEVTLRFEDKAFVPWPWTYADYQEPFVREFLREARNFYKKRLALVSRDAERSATN